MTIEELNKRANEVFDLDYDEFVLRVYVEGMDFKFGVHVKIYNTKTDEITDYQPDMSDRPQALTYLLGEREDFND